MPTDLPLNHGPDCSCATVQQMAGATRVSQESAQDIWLSSVLHESERYVSGLARRLTRLGIILTRRNQIPWTATAAILVVALATFGPIRGAMVAIGYGALIFAGVSILERSKSLRGGRRSISPRRPQALPQPRRLLALPAGRPAIRDRAHQKVG